MRHLIPLALVLSACTSHVPYTGSIDPDLDRRIARELGGGAMVVAIVEGVDDITSRLVQARHSYALENFAWWHNFAPCVFRQPGGSCLVDFGEFHRTVDPSLGAASPQL